MNDYYLFRPPFFIGRFPLLLLVLLSLVACRSAADREQTTDRSPHFLVVDTFRIPVFATPEDQLAYARATFEQIEEKSAALKAMKAMHPTSRLHVVMAELELAYLQLGADYRLADDRQSALATERYLVILKEYEDYPEIAAKSLWYLGWITCDLRHDKTQGLEYYLKIIDRYPRETVNFLPPAPWLTIRPTDENIAHRPYYPKSSLSWASIAHLEIIRNTANREDAWLSFSAILEEHGNDAFTGLALKTLITTQGFENRAALHVKKYLADNTADHTLKNDLLFALANFLRDSPPEARPQ